MSRTLLRVTLTLDSLDLAMEGVLAMAAVLAMAVGVQGLAMDRGQLVDRVMDRGREDQVMDQGQVDKVMDQVLAMEDQ